MIINHKIKNINNEEILFIHLDFNFEFGGFEKLKKNTKDLTQNIKHYLKSKKINFKGKLIFLLVNGIIIGTLVLAPNVNLNKHEELTNYQFVNNINFKIPKIDKEVNNNKVFVSKEPVENEVQNVVKQKENIKKEVPINKNTNTTTSNKEQMVSIKRSTGNTISINLEEYLIGVVGSEMPASFHIEALKAQAVAARTYALKKISEGVTLTDTVKHQVYKDNNQLKKIWGSNYNTYYNKVKTAVEATKGKTIKYNNKYIDAMYHSTNNGKTESSKDVFGNNHPYLISVDSPWDKEAPSYQREIEKNITEVSKALNLQIDQDSTIQIIQKTDGNNIAVAKIEGKEYSGVELRNLLGLRSADFDLKVADGTIKITTRGYGHGVGMSQYGANGMAKAGYTYDQILKHYYPNTTIN